VPNTPDTWTLVSLSGYQACLSCRSVCLHQYIAFPGVMRLQQSSADIRRCAQVASSAGLIRTCQWCRATADAYRCSNSWTVASFEVPPRTTIATVTLLPHLVFARKAQTPSFSFSPDHTKAMHVVVHSFPKRLMLCRFVRPGLDTCGRRGYRYRTKPLF